MKISGGIEEQGIVVGNAYDKYGSRNPIVKRLMAGFHHSLEELVRIANPESIHEIGCGEGFWVLEWIGQDFNCRGSDFSSAVIEIARQNAVDQKAPAEIFSQKSIYELECDPDSADLMVCCEVLEHLEEPEQALLRLQSVTRKNLILSVPREPLWRVMNMARGRYLAQAGNTPGHLQHWSSRDFIALVADYFDIIEVRQPTPWTMLLCRPAAESS